MILVSSKCSITSGEKIILFLELCWNHPLKTPSTVHIKFLKKGTEHYIFKCSAEVLIYINCFKYLFEDCTVKNWVLLW